jgi:sulfopyruvate decarboxylase subunit beta
MVEKMIDEICKAINRVGVNLVLQLPCDRISPLLDVITERFANIPLTREEEGVGIAAGAALAGAKPLMIVQSSGMGNMVNAILSLTQFYQLPLPIIISHRGVYKENVTAQVPMGSRLPKILDAMEVKYSSYQEPDDLKNFETELESTFKQESVKCFLFSPKLFEGMPKQVQASEPFNLPEGAQNLHKDTGDLQDDSLVIIEEPKVTRSRKEQLEGLTGFLKNKAIICNMGYPARELYSIMDQDSNFYMLGSLGLASSIGLGVALYSEKDVVVIDGDGSLLMNPNALISIGALQPENLSVICIDNGVYGSTGNQPTWCTYNFKLEQFAKAVGIKRIMVTDDQNRVNEFDTTGSSFIRLLAKPGNAKVGTIDIDQLEIKSRFQKWLLE